MTSSDILFITIFLQIVQVLLRKRIGRKIIVTEERRKHNTRTDIVYLAFVLLGIQSPSWIADSRLASLEIPGLSCNPQVHYRFHNSPLIVPILSQTNPIYIPIPLRSILISTSYQRCSSVGIATGYWLDDRGVGVRVPVGSRIYSSPCRPDRLWATSYSVSTGDSFPWVKAAGA
jgi:hypothetical protein